MWLGVMSSTTILDFRPHRVLRESQSGAPHRLYDANFQTASKARVHRAPASIPSVRARIPSVRAPIPPVVAPTCRIPARICRIRARVRPVGARVSPGEARARWTRARIRSTRPRTYRHRHGFLLPLSMAKPTAISIATVSKSSPPTHERQPRKAGTEKIQGDSFVGLFPIPSSRGHPAPPSIATNIPGHASSNTAITSAFRIRMQPWDRGTPILEPAGQPWI
uniref:Uncharacterized protein n=1 Tax=Candidatus Kentrum eta TaxID=2126337 RepID=A0A450UBF5_9GAMM|nr:MAG: hypothetical protein BECKH772A_GA0070896_1001510 [Candidatus Kentron sp. H]VFJ90997.1 MAG: hypothetical protein BECKH772B_GA0070898_1001310 [Candidatus Kentron sp. H]VFJ97318.1 MAG: hypothetical protein BECKH772C_GA0070978_1001210 [Candidatus Kentron sp. H]